MTDREDAGVVENDRRNAAVTWTLVCGLCLAGAARALAGEVLWAGFAAASVVIVSIPAVVRRDPLAMPAWEVVTVVAVPIAIEAIGAPSPVLEAATYLAVAGLALAVVVELHEFSAMEMTARFGAALVVLLTMASAGVWTIVRWYSDRLLGTTYYAGMTQTELMWDMATATAVGVVGALVSWAYVRRRGLATAPGELSTGGETAADGEATTDEREVSVDGTS